ncbi:MAG: AAA family ATPase [Chloroflexi bacterium]|nr:MAG: AAA family ATPase [Chloroflexota bacterium]
MPTSSTTNSDDLCQICGKQAICNGMGVIKYEVPIDHPNFGKLFRCPNNPPSQDITWRDRLRALGNLSAYAEQTFANFEYDLMQLLPAEQASLEHAFNTAQRFAEHPQGWLLLEGEYGCGKTHLAAAIANYHVDQGDSVLFITVPDLLDHLRAAYGPSSEVGYDEMFESIRNAPLLILDDLGVENPSPWAQEKLFQLLNHRYVKRLPTIITTNVDINTLDSRIRSRMLDRDVVSRVIINAPDYRSKVQNERKELQTSLTLYKDMTFETFETNRFANAEEQQNLIKAAESAYSFAQDPQGILLLIGDYGSGKTHLAAAIANYRSQRGDKVMFVTVPDLLDYLRVTFNPSSPATFDQRFHAVRNVKLLILDDIGTENPTAWVKEKLFQIIDYRYVAKLPTVLTTSKNFEQLDERLQTRLLDERRCYTLAITARSYSLRRRLQKR